MKLTTKMRYGTRAMLELALHHEQGPLSLAEIAVSQELPDKYLESMFRALHSAGLVRSQRGPQGGYALARPPEQIDLRDIYEVLEGAQPFVQCTVDRSLCPRSPTCVTQEVWARMYEAAMQVLQSTTLADLVARDSNRSATAASYII